MTDIYKIFLPAQWAGFQASGMFNGAPIDISDGYIHLSAKKQVVETANKHFAQYEEIILARIDADALPADLTPKLKWEASRGGAKFPHLYAPLPFSVVAAYWSVEKGDDGFAFPDDF